MHLQSHYLINVIYNIIITMQYFGNKMNKCFSETNKSREISKSLIRSALIQSQRVIELTRHSRL